MKVPRSPPASSSVVAAVMRGNSRRRDTRPELAVRRLLTRMGYRYRLHQSHLPGRPDISFPGRRKVIFVHGCFWHQHASEHCTLKKYPRTNLEYWRPKLRRNVERDAENVAALRSQGWRVRVVWECETAQQSRLMATLKRFLD